MVNTLPSLPTWFITLSSRDLEWPDMIRGMLRAKHAHDQGFDVDSIDIKEMDSEARMDLLRDFPVIAARHFNHRFNAFLKFIKAHPNLLGGKVIHHWYRVEFQARGSPHIHMLVWVENAPRFDTTEGLY